MEKTMLGVLKDGNKTRLGEVPMPVCGDNDVLLRVDYAPICGSDLHGIRGGKMPSSGREQVMGHEVGGTIIEMGKNVKGYEIGEFVTGETHIICGECYQCRNGEQHICQNVKVPGFHVPGTWAQYFSMPAYTAMKVPKNISQAEASIMEPLGVAYHALSFSDVRGDTVAVVGCGVIGLMAVELAKVMGASKVIGISRSQINRDRALAFGADIDVDSTAQLAKDILDITDGVGVGTTIDMSGAASIIEEEFKMTRKGGKMVMAGCPQQPVTIQDMNMNFVMRELKLYGMHGRRMYEGWTPIFNLLEAGMVDLKKYITAEVGLNDYMKGVEMASSSDHLKVLLRP